MSKKSVFHESGDGACGGLAFYSLANGGEFGTIPSSCVDDIELPDGTKPAVAEPLRCAACGGIWSKVVSRSIMVVVRPSQAVQGTPQGGRSETSSSQP